MKSEFELKTKQNLRVQAKKIRNSLDIQTISSAIARQLIMLDAYKKAKIVAGFYPFGHEVDLRQLYHDLTKKWHLPRLINDTKITFYPFKSPSKMEKNKYGIHEPACGKELGLSEMDIIIAPALMVDKNGHRLGYGKGYYDRFLSKLPEKCLKIVPIPEELLIESLPIDNFDISVDIAVTQDKIYYF